MSNTTLETLRTLSARCNITLYNHTSVRAIAAEIQEQHYAACDDDLACLVDSIEAHYYAPEEYGEAL
jgi:hypothetical protein